MIITHSYLYLHSERVNYRAAELTILPTTRIKTTTITMSERVFVFTLRLLDNNSVHVVVLYRHQELRLFIIIKKALRLMLTVVDAHTHADCMCTQKQQRS